MNNKDLVKAQHEVAITVANALIAEDMKIELAEKTKTRDEREKLLSEAYKMAGRIEGINIVSKFANVSNLLLLKHVKESKIYRDIPNIGTWAKYCEYLGFSRAKIDMDLDNLEVFGEEFLQTVGTFQIGYRELRKLRSASKDGVLSIDDNTITIEVGTDDEPATETISLSDTDGVRDALERLISAKNEAIFAKERELKAAKEVQEFQSHKTDKIEKELNQTSNELMKIKNAGTIGGIPVDDYPAYNKLERIVRELSALYVELKRLQNDETLSNDNTLYLHGTIMHMVTRANELLLYVPYFGDLEVTNNQLNDAIHLPIPGVTKIDDVTLKNWTIQ